MRWSRRLLLAAGADLALVLLAWWLAFWLRFNLDVPNDFAELALRAAPWCVLAYAAALMVTGVCATCGAIPACRSCGSW
jgi:hypothetical protein